MNIINEKYNINFIIENIFPCIKKIRKKIVKKINNDFIIL